MISKSFTPAKLVKNHRARHSVTYPAHLKSDGYSHEMAARQLEVPLAERSDRGLIKNIVPSAFEYLY